MTSAEDYASQRQACSIPPVTDSTITVSSATDLFRSDGLFDSRKLPTPSLMYAANFTPPDHGTTSPTIHRPSSSWQRTSSVSSQDSGYFTTLSMQSSVDTLEPNITAVPNGPTRSSLSMSKSGQVPTREAQRQACIPCRRKKVGCDLRMPGNTDDPPCQRCRHENLECVFSAGSENIPDNPSPQELPSIRDLACPHCSLVFLRDEDLRAHLRTQCSEKHYVCPTCQARFRRLNDLDRHQRIHTGERPHTCDICGRRFSRATTLTRHRQGPEGCAGRRADLGRRRLGSTQSVHSQSSQSSPVPRNNSIVTFSPNYQING